MSGRSTRRVALRPLALLLAAGVALTVNPTPAWAGAGGVPTIRMNPPGDRRAAFEVVGLDPAVADALAREALGPEQWSALFAVATVPADAPTTGDQDRPSMLGTYRVESGILRFRPRFPLEPGVVYRARFDPTRLPATRRNDGDRVVVSAEFVLPKKPEAPTTRLTAVYPTRDTLPENQLKLYLQFSAPMGRGAAYEHIRLRGDDGKDLDLPFLELAEELWDPGGMRLTVLFDPGRIKTGLKPREELGPVLQRGKSYTLVIDREWPDAEGRPLVDAFRKTFRVGPPDHTCPDPTTWTLDVPMPGTRDALTVTSPEPLDRAMLARVLTILDAEGRTVPGAIAIEAEETRWRFTPENPWKAGGYRVSVSKDLEDLAGNRIGRPFEVDVFEKIDQRPTAETVAVPFRIGAPGR